jgi:hypothetical protein
MIETNKELIDRFNQIMIERKKIEIKLKELDREHDEIVFELWERLPNLKDDVNIQPKKKVRK